MLWGRKASKKIFLEKPSLFACYVSFWLAFWECKYKTLMAIGFSPRCLTSMNQSIETWRRGTRITGVRHVQIHKPYPFSQNHGSVANDPKWKETIILKGPHPFSTEPWWEESVHLALPGSDQQTQGHDLECLGGMFLSDTDTCPQKGIWVTYQHDVKNVGPLWMDNLHGWVFHMESMIFDSAQPRNIEPGLRFRGFKAFRSSIHSGNRYKQP